MVPLDRPHMIFTVQRYASVVSGVVVCPNVCLSVCLSVRLSVTKRLNVGSCKQRHTISQAL